MNSIEIWDFACRIPICNGYRRLKYQNFAFRLNISTVVGQWKYKISFITQQSIFWVFFYFFAMSWVTELFHLSINMTIDWHYTMAWLPTSLLKTHRRLSTYATTMRVRFVYEMRCNATMVKIRHGLATLNSNNSVVYGQKLKVWVLVFLVRASGTFWDQTWADLVKFSVLQQNRIIYSNSVQERLLSISPNGLGYKTVISCLFVV